MSVDQHDNPITGDADAVALYDRAVDALLRFDPAVIGATKQLLTSAPDVPMGQALVAYLQLSSSDGTDVAGARSSVETLAALDRNEREEAHRRALAAWVDGDWTGAGAALDDLLLRWPADLLALQLGHQLDFFVGDAANLRGRPGRTLVDLDPDHPHTGFVRGMHAFGLEESGHYGAAEAAGLAALDANPDDVWAIHAVTHVREMQGRVDEGIALLLDRRDDWATGNLFTVHNWWHLTLFLLEAGRTDEVLATYDAEIHHARSPGMALDLLDASALLWRLHLDGVDVGDRFAVLADAWAARLAEPSWYAFNDLHAVIALVGAGRVADADRHVASIAAQPQTPFLAVGVPASRAFVRFAQERYDDAIADLAPLRRTSHRFGGSHAQRDVLQRTLLEASLRAGQTDLARALVNERLSVRESSVYGWGQRARLLRQLGDPAAAADAEAVAAGHRHRFATAVLPA